MDAAVWGQEALVPATRRSDRCTLRKLLLAGVVGSKIVKGPLHGVSCELASCFMVSPYEVEVRVPRSASVGCLKRPGVYMEAILQQQNLLGTGVIARSCHGQKHYAAEMVPELRFQPCKHPKTKRASNPKKTNPKPGLKNPTPTLFVGAWNKNPC